MLPATWLFKHFLVKRFYIRKGSFIGILGVMDIGLTSTAMTTFITTNERNDNGLFDRWLFDDENNEVCKAEIMKDKDGNAVVVQLDTPAEFRGKGYARKMLEAIGTKDTDNELRVISTETALGYYRKIGYTEIAPHIFATRF